ncbi:MAG: VapE domain-containing protein, partial [Betaproteobacteria bacterium]
VASAAGVMPAFGLGARPEHLGGKAGVTAPNPVPMEGSVVGEMPPLVVEDTVSAADVAGVVAVLKRKVKESETHYRKCKEGNGAEHDWQGAKLAGLLKGDVEWMREYVRQYPTRKSGTPVGWFDVAGAVDYGNAVYSACHEMAKVALPQHVTDGDVRKAQYDVARKALLEIVKVDGVQGVLMWCMAEHSFNAGKANEWLVNQNVTKVLSNRQKFLATLHAEALLHKAEALQKETALKTRLKADDYHKNLMGKLRELYAKPWHETEHLAGDVDFSKRMADDVEFLQYSDGKYPRPLCTAENVALLLGYYGCRARHNEMRHMMEYEGFGVGEGDHEGALSLVWRLVMCNGLPWEMPTVDRMLQTWAGEYKFHPVKDWIGSKPWDGESRIEALADTITVADGQRDMWLIYLRRWLLGAINALYSKQGGASKHMLVLQGAQSAGKTSWFRKLAGGNPVCKDGVMLDVKNKDSVRETLTWWLIELGELEATYQTRQIAELKAFVTKQSDEWRDPFARRQNVYPRRTAFVGTVNKDEPLADFTGNTRFATVTAEKINYTHDVDMQQVWAEVLSIWLHGTDEEKRHYLSRDEEKLMEAQNERYVANGVAFDVVEFAFDWSDKGKAEMQRAHEVRDRSHFMAAAEIYQWLEAVGYKVVGQSQKNEVGHALTKLGAIKDRGTGGVKGYWLPKPNPKAAPMR